jgi:hypothetical protein
MVDKKTIEKVKHFPNDEKTAKLYVYEKLVEHLQGQQQQSSDPEYRGGKANKRDARRELFRLQVALRTINSHLNDAKNFLQKKG